MTTQPSAEHPRIDPAHPMRDAHGHLIGTGDRIRHLTGGTTGRVIGTTLLGDTRLVRYIHPDHPLAGTMAVAPDEVVVQ